MNIRRNIIFLLMITLSQYSFSQYYETGEDPASLKWLQIKTPRFTVVYPESYGEAALTFTRSLDEAYSKLSTLYPEKKFNIPVIIHNYSTRSNGYVAWAPRRMEIYPAPEQNSIPLMQSEQLALHELTHVFQMVSLTTGFTKGLSYLVGEQATGMVAALLPLWFYEGNAVFAESALSESGRGRVPSFQKQLKAIALGNNSMFKYDKFLNGSYRNYIPDHYQSGYQMLAWSMSKYDTKIWNKVLDFTGKEPFTINPVNISLSKSAGLTKRKLFTETFDSLSVLWARESENANNESYAELNPDKERKFINYYSPVVCGTDSIIAIKTTLGSPPAFVLINTSAKTEQIIHFPGQLYPWYISYANGRLVWVEQQPDPRWDNRDYSVIKILNISDKTFKRITKKSRYFSASLSADGKKIVAVENTIEDDNRLVFLDAADGSILESVDSPGNYALQRPQWAQGSDKITVILLTEEGEGISEYNLISHTWSPLINPSRDDIQSSYLRNDSLFYISSASGTDNIYLRKAEGKISDITRSILGVSDMSVSGMEVFFSDYSVLGNKICSAKITDNTGESPEQATSTFLINRFNNKEQPSVESAVTDYTPFPYRKWQHLFRFHSWMPFYADLEEIKSDPTALRPGATVMTQNLLSTLTSTIGYEYTEDKNHLLHSKLTWKGWYPVIESQLDYGYNPLIEKLGESVGDPMTISRGMKFTNTVSVPLKFSPGSFSQFIRPSVSTSYTNRYVYLKETGAYDFGQTIVTARLYFSNYKRSSYRDIYPVLSQVFDLSYSYAPFDKLIYGSTIALKTAFFFPGILPNNSIRLRLEKESQSPVKYLFNNRVTYPRSYNYINSRELQLVSIDYRMPLSYPDFTISSLLYLKRIRAGLFYDYGLGTGNTYYSNTSGVLRPTSYHDYQEKFKSFGFELLADFHILRIPFMISGGLQSAWKSFGEAPSFELLFNIDLYGMTLGKRPF